LYLEPITGITCNCYSLADLLNQRELN